MVAAVIYGVGVGRSAVMAGLSSVAAAHVDGGRVAAVAARSSLGGLVPY